MGIDPDVLTEEKWIQFYAHSLYIHKTTHESKHDAFKAALYEVANDVLKVFSKDVNTND